MKYENQEPTVLNPEGTSMWRALGKMIKGVPDRRPRTPIPNIPVDLDQLGDQDGYIWLGHSSVFLQLDGIRILIDPVFSKRASPFPFTGPKAFAYSFDYTAEQFENMDLILQTHDHYDHLDKKNIQVLSQSAVQVLVPSGLKRMLMNWGIAKEKITERSWGDVFEYQTLKIYMLQARHFSGRGMLNRNTTLWCSYGIRSSQLNVFHSGDSGYGGHFAEIGAKYGPFDLAFLECGQYNENWPLIHMMPEESVQAAIDLGSKKMLPIHHSRFALSIHPWREPVERASLAATNQGQSLTLPKPGELVYFDLAKLA